MPAIVHINVIGILLAVIAGMVIGAVWYGIFSAQWIKAMGKKKADIKGTIGSYILQTVYALITAYILTHFIDYTGARTLVAGAETGFWLWFGFVATTSAGTNLWENKNWNLWLINNGNYLLTLMAMGAILALYK